MPDFTPDRDAFRRLARQGNLIPVCREIMADLDTPVSAFLKLGGADNAFLLESVEGGESWARYSFIGSGPRVVITGQGGRVTVTGNGSETELPHDGNPLLAVRDYLRRFTPVQVEGLPPFIGGAVGYIAYDMVRHFDKVPIDLKGKPGLGLPDFQFLVTDRLVAFDRQRQVIQVVAHAHVEAGSDPDAAYDRAVESIGGIVATLRGPLPKAEAPEALDHSEGEPAKANLTDGQYRQMVLKAKEYIAAGDIFQVVLSRRVSTRLGCAPFDVYRALRQMNPSPYMYFLKLGDTCVAGASPEILVRTQHGKVELRPIAGTRPRGVDEDEDEQLEKDMLADPKERAEHLMLVDLGRNDVGRVARTGTVTVDDFMVVERYSHVMHMVSHVTGELAGGKDAFDVLTACFPAGTLSGAPKVRAMQIIEELEPTARGLYGGAVGYFGFDGSSDMAINIRTVLVKDGTAYIQAGAGIVADSDPESEYRETVNKAMGPMRAIQMAQEGLEA
ncbi:MAG: anthranilate synthase component I [Nitrospirota bacterium]|nr:anthranilate synthase component I [Nitrospirota bacterium]